MAVKENNQINLNEDISIKTDNVFFVNQQHRNEYKRLFSDRYVSFDEILGEKKNFIYYFKNIFFKKNSASQKIKENNQISLKENTYNKSENKILDNQQQQHEGMRPTLERLESLDEILYGKEDFSESCIDWKTVVNNFWNNSKKNLDTLIKISVFAANNTIIDVVNIVKNCWQQKNKKNLFSCEEEKNCELIELECPCNIVHCFSEKSDEESEVEVSLLNTDEKKLAILDNDYCWIELVTMNNQKQWEQTNH